KGLRVASQQGRKSLSGGRVRSREPSEPRFHWRNVALPLRYPFLLRSPKVALGVPPLQFAAPVIGVVPLVILLAMKPAQHFAVPDDYRRNHEQNSQEGNPQVLERSPQSDHGAPRFR